MKVFKTMWHFSFNEYFSTGNKQTASGSAILASNADGRGELYVNRK